MGSVDGRSLCAKGSVWVPDPSKHGVSVDTILWTPHTCSACPAEGAATGSTSGLTSHWSVSKPGLGLASLSGPLTPRRDGVVFLTRTSSGTPEKQFFLTNSESVQFKTLFMAHLLPCPNVVPQEGAALHFLSTPSPPPRYEVYPGFWKETRPMITTMGPHSPQCPLR